MAQPTPLVTMRPVVVYDDAKPSLNSDKKAQLQVVGNGKSVNPCFFLDAGVHLKVVAPGSFDMKEIMGDSKTGEAFKETKVTYACALVEVLDGPAKGKKGWVVLSRSAAGKFNDLFIGAEPKQP